MADPLVGWRAVHWVASMVEPKAGLMAAMTADLRADLMAATTVAH